MEGVQDWFEGLWDYIGTATINAVAPVSQWIHERVAWLKDRLDESFTWIGGKIGDVRTAVLNALTEGWKTVTTAIGLVAGDVLAGVKDLIAGVGEGLDWIVESIGKTIESGLAGFSDTLSNTAAWIDREIGDRIRDLNKDISGMVADLAQGGMDWVTQAMAGVAGAIGDGLKDLFSWIMESLGNLAEGLMKSAAGISKTVEPLIAPYLVTIMKTVTGTLMPGSPEKEVKEQADELTKALMEALAKNIPEKGESPPALEVLLASSAAIIGTNIALDIGLSGVTMGLDLVHPVKEIGFRQAGDKLLNSFGLPAMIGPTLQAPVWSGVIAPLRMRMNEKFPYLVPGPRDLMDMVTRGTISEDDYRQSMKFHALDDSWAAAMKAAAYRTPAFSDLQLMYWRGEIGEADVGEALGRQGLLPELIPPYLKIMERIPGPGDLVRMAVREAFQARPGDEEISGTFIAQMGLQGYIEEAVKWFWRAHWVLPSVGQVFDMYHRGIKMPLSVTAFLKWADYAPEWRGPLEELSWDLPGRIDARWMFRWGLISVTELRDLLVARGLDPKWADRVASATAKNQWLTEINRLRDNAKRRYVKGYDTEETLRANLEGLGYPPDWVNFHVRDATEDGEMELKDDMVAALSDGYLRDLVTDDALEISLKAIIVRPRAAQMEMERLFIRKYKKPKDPTPEKVRVVPLSTLKRAFRDGLITEADFRAELVARDYGPVDIDMLVSIEAAAIAEEMADMPEVTKTATLGTLRAAFREGVITVDTLISELEARGYGIEDIDLIVSVEEARMEE